MKCFFEWMFLSAEFFVDDCHRRSGRRLLGVFLEREVIMSHCCCCCCYCCYDDIVNPPVIAWTAIAVTSTLSKEEVPQGEREPSVDFDVVGWRVIAFQKSTAPALRLLKSLTQNSQPDRCLRRATTSTSEHNSIGSSRRSSTIATTQPTQTVPCCADGAIGASPVWASMKLLEESPSTRPTLRARRGIVLYFTFRCWL